MFTVCSLDRKETKEEIVNRNKGIVPQHLGSLQHTSATLYARERASVVNKLIHFKLNKNISIYMQASERENR